MSLRDAKAQLASSLIMIEERPPGKYAEGKEASDLERLRSCLSKHGDSWHVHVFEEF